MSIFEIISAIVLIIACVFIVVVVLLKDTKTQMSQTISGTSSDSFYQKNAGRTKDAMLNKATVVAVIIFFVLAIAVNIINVYFGGSKGSSSSSSSGKQFEQRCKLLKYLRLRADERFRRNKRQRGQRILR